MAIIYSYPRRSPLASDIMLAAEISAPGEDPPVVKTFTVGQLIELIEGGGGVYAPLDSPQFTGAPYLPIGTIGVTRAISNNSTSLATTAFVQSVIAAIAPGQQNLLQVTTKGNVTTTPIEANSFVKTGGTNLEFLMADGDVTIGNGGVYSYEIHVSQIDGNDTTGTGAVLNPVASITKALTLITGQRKTIIIHPGTYTESPNIAVQYTVLTSLQNIGGNTLISGTVSTSTGCTISGLKMTNLTITGTSGTGNINILNCDISGTLTKSGTADYVLIRFCDIGNPQAGTGGLSVTSSAGLTAVFGGNPNFIRVNNAGARVLIKNATTAASVLLAGSLIFADSIILALATQWVAGTTYAVGSLAYNSGFTYARRVAGAGSTVPASDPTNWLLQSSLNGIDTRNAITTAIGSIITIANSQIIVPTFQNVARISLGGIYSELNTVYDRPNSTLSAYATSGGFQISGSTDSIIYSQFMNADKFIKQGGTSAELLAANGDSITAGTGINISGGIISSTATGGITGTGTTNYIPKFTGTTAVGNSQIFDNGTNIGVGTTIPTAKVHVKDSGSTTNSVTYFTDNYNRASLSPGGTPSVAYSVSSSGVNISAVGVNLYSISMATNNAYNYAFATYPSFPSNNFNPVLSGNSATLQWAINTRQSQQTILTGFGTGQAGQAFVLACNMNNPSNTSAFGYALVYGIGGTTSTWSLVRFGGGLINNANITTIITGPAPPSPSDARCYYALRVTYIVATNTWSLYVVADGFNTSWTNPLLANTFIGSATNNTYTSNSLPHFSFVYNAITSNGFFGNFTFQNILSTTFPTAVKVEDGNTSQLNGFTILQNLVALDAETDAAAALLNVPLYGVYRTGNTLKVRTT